MLALRQALQGLQDFRVIGKPAGAVLGIDQQAVGGNVEYAAATLDELGLHAKIG